MRREEMLCELADDGLGLVDRWPPLGERRGAAVDIIDARGASKPAARFLKSNRAHVALFLSIRRTVRVKHPTSRVLVLSDQPLVAALVGMLVELVGFVPAFAEVGERPEEAVRRVRPLLVVLLDAELDAARSDLFFAQAAKRKVGLAVFGPTGSERELAAIARQRGVPWAEIPASSSAFADLLERAAAAQWWRSGADRRRSPDVDPTSDGGLQFVDHNGRRWQVYDRRGAQRRRDDPLVVQRTFVDEEGARWELSLRPEEIDPATPPTAAALEEQIARATKR